MFSRAAVRHLNSRPPQDLLVLASLKVRYTRGFPRGAESRLDTPGVTRDRRVAGGPRRRGGVTGREAMFGVTEMCVSGVLQPLDSARAG